MVFPAEVFGSIGRGPVLRFGAASICCSGSVGDNREGFVVRGFVEVGIGEEGRGARLKG